MKICNLFNDIELHCSIHGEPFYYKKGKTWEICDYIAQDDKIKVNDWQSLSENDCLRARGDIRWIASCDFTSRPHYGNKN